MSTQIARSTRTPFEDILQSKFYTVNSLKEAAKEATRDEGFRLWLDTAEGVQALESYRRFLDHYLDSACTRIIDKSLTLLMDRLEFGDICYTLKGEAYRAEIDASTLSKVFSSVFDRRQLIRKNPTLILNESASLENLAQALDRLGTSKPTLVAVQVVNKLEPFEAENIIAERLPNNGD